MINQIRVVAILTIVHGAMACAAGLLYMALGILMPIIAANTHPSGGFPPSGNQAPWFVAVYFALGAPAVIVGVLQIFAGWRNYGLRSRTLGIVAVLGGIVASSTCYCAPTAIALAIYGLIVLLNSGVAQAFAWRAEGATADEVLARVYQPYVPAQTAPSASTEPTPSSGPGPPPAAPEDPPAAPPTKPFSPDS